MWRVEEVTVVCVTVNVKCALRHFCVLLTVSWKKVSCYDTPASELVDLFPSSSLSLQQRTDLSYIVHGWQLINAWRRVRNPGRVRAAAWPRIFLGDTLYNSVLGELHTFARCVVSWLRLQWSVEIIRAESFQSPFQTVSHIYAQQRALIHNDRVLFTLVSNNFKMRGFQISLT